MLSKLPLIIILILQILITGLIYKDGENVFNAPLAISIIQLLVIAFGVFAGFILLKKEIKSKKKLEIYDNIAKLVADLVNSIHSIGYLFESDIEKSNPKDPNDLYNKWLKSKCKKLINDISSFNRNLLSFYEFFQISKAVFNEKLDREMKFLFDLGSVYVDDLGMFREKLSNYSMLSLMKSSEDISKEKDKLILLCKKINKKNIVFNNGLSKFVSDTSNDVFGSLFKLSEKDRKRLFDLELENSEDGDPLIVLTENGFTDQFAYKKTAFQNEFGGYKERQAKIREILEN